MLYHDPDPPVAGAAFVFAKGFQDDMMLIVYAGVMSHEEQRRGWRITPSRGEKLFSPRRSFVGATTQQK
jgi:hypothetical protein